MHSSSPTRQFTYDEPKPKDMINGLIDFLNDKVDHQNPTEYMIAECFPHERLENYEPKAYHIINLEMEQENGIVYCYDLIGKLKNQKYILSGFCTDSVLYIGYQENKVTISFDDGYIQIYY